MGDLSRATELFRDQPNNPEALEKINAYRHFRLNCLQTSLKFIERAKPPKRVLISARLKRIRSIRRKIIRGQKGSITEMDDIVGFRVICESFSEAKSMGSRIEDIPEARIKNYLHTHQANIGYRAQHGIIKFNQPFRDSTVKVRFEIQIRTWYQHLWACWCESHGEHAKEGLKNSLGNEKGIRELKELFLKNSKLIADWEQIYSDQTQLELPKYSDPFIVALAWHNNRKNFEFDSLGPNVDDAVEELYRLESFSDIEPLLLVGIGKSEQIKNILKKTHPNFMQRGFLDPQYWLPKL